MVQGREADRFVQGCLERPRNALQVLRSRLLAPVSAPCEQDGRFWQEERTMPGLLLARDDGHQWQMRGGLRQPDP
jgi:hypothetical protein